VTITEAGRTVTIEQRVALFKALVARAIKGDTRSAALVIRLMEQSGSHREPQQRITRIERVIISAETGL
jgi:chorismate mutase